MIFIHLAICYYEEEVEEERDNDSSVSSSNLFQSLYRVADTVVRDLLMLSHVLQESDNYLCFL